VKIAGQLITIGSLLLTVKKPEDGVTPSVGQKNENLRVAGSISVQFTMKDMFLW
jgi:hypothetical protein